MPETAAELKELRLARGHLKSALTRFGTFVDGFTDDKVVQLESRLEKIEPSLEEFEKLQTKIELLDINELESNELINFEHSYFDITEKAKIHIKRLDSITKAENRKTETNVSQTVVQSTQQQSNVKYPILELPKFFGDYDKWGQFRDMFSALVHKNNQMENIKKFYYLVSCLKGEAAKIIDSMEITDDNYPTAWELLVARYENKQLTIKNHVRALFELPSTGNKESHTALRRLTDEVEKHIRALTILKEPVDSWHTLLIYLVVTKLDLASAKSWEEYSITKKLESPKYTDLTAFLSERCQLLETIERKTGISGNLPDNSSKPFYKNKTYEKTVSNVVQNANNSCAFCKQAHPIYFCEKLKALPIASRLSEVKRLRLCTNCFRKNHSTMECTAQGCKKCYKKHNTLLHIESNHTNASVSKQVVGVEHPIDSVSVSVSTPTSESGSSGLLAGHCFNPEPQILLSTAIILIRNRLGNWQKCRALIDNGSMPNFITRNLCSKLNLATLHTNTPVVGVGKSSTNIAKRTQAVIRAVHSDFKAELSFFIIESITERLPLISFDPSKLEIPNRIVLADPDFNISKQIDVLIGAGIFCDLLKAGIVKLGDGLPVLQNTLLGWIVSGPIITYRQTSNRVTCNLATNENINNTNTIENQLERFWNIEECQQRKNISLEEQECEQTFIKTVQRDDSNHFVVSLPIRENAGFIGESLQNAVKRLQSMEVKFRKNIAFKQQYNEFLTEYEALGHMTKIDNSEINEAKSVFYLPHHGVVNEASESTKLRVVFDGSCKSTSGVALNDILKVGPTLQDDLFAILIRFRKHNFVMTGDIEKMYRQVYVTEHQRDLQRIVWRQNESDEIQHYKLNTVTYGTSSAAYLAIRSLQQVAIEKVDQFPEIGEVILHDFYVDDLLTGCDSVDNAIALKSDLTKILSEYGFNLRKWVANDPRITGKSQNRDYQIADNDTTRRTLGLIWQSNSDILKYSAVQLNPGKNATKRTVLSAIATLFDPLGLVAPVTIRAKLIMQKLWEKRLDWDAPLPADLFDLWVSYNRQLGYVNQIEQPRHVLIRDSVYIELHGFCDSSQSAYGSCIYLLSRDAAGNVFVRLLCAKSRVAPLKVQTLPRLELCGAILLINLYKKIVDSLKINIDNVSFWTDSTIVLSWISAEPSKWKTFVANRVSEIQSVTKIEQWGHVVSKENPADLITRGVNPRDLIHNTLWWNGPTWLTLERNHRPNGLQQTISENIPEKRKVKPCCFTVASDFNIFDRYSTLYRLLRVVALCIRFSHNISKPSQRKNGELTIEEINHALIILLKISQTESFSNEIKAIQMSKQISNKSRLLSLNPFVDNQGLLRVGGRLSKSSVSYDRKYPIILAPKHPLTRMIILDEHHRQLHSGAQTLLASLRERYWPLSGRATVRSVLRKCLTCFRVNPIAAIRKMGDLPLDRVSINRPFTISGVDFAGPFSIKDGKLRNRSMVKSYLCIFVCFTTKAVHLEAVSDLGKAAFLNALKRFVSRRGLPRIIYSDNGTNFVGANNEMKQIVQSLSEFVSERDYSEFFLKNNIEWRFTPPYSPHHGGLWEAAVKRAKYHINRVIGKNSTTLTFEEIDTIFAQVEAIINSRPLTPLSTDPNDLTVLTPGHFLIGSSLSSLPQRNLTHFPENRLKHYERMQQSVQHFWSRWSREYLSQIQERTKWKQGQKDPMELGAMVVLISEGNPPLSWKLGRIVELHPGSDGIVRVVTVKTETGLTKRAVQRLCLLPIEQ